MLACSIKKKNNKNFQCRAKKNMKNFQNYFC